jgi:hypothetical protein
VIYTYKKTLNALKLDTDLFFAVLSQSEFTSHLTIRRYTVAASLYDPQKGPVYQTEIQTVRFMSTTGVTATLT